MAPNYVVLSTSVDVLPSRREHMYFSCLFRETFLYTIYISRCSQYYARSAHSLINLLLYFIPSTIRLFYFTFFTARHNRNCGLFQGVDRQTGTGCTTRTNETMCDGKDRSGIGRCWKYSNRGEERRSIGGHEHNGKCIIKRIFFQFWKELLYGIEIGEIVFVKAFQQDYKHTSHIIEFIRINIIYTDR